MRRYLQLRLKFRLKQDVGELVTIAENSASIASQSGMEESVNGPQVARGFSALPNTIT